MKEGKWQCQEYSIIDFNLKTWQFPTDNVWFTELIKMAKVLKNCFAQRSPHLNQPTSISWSIFQTTYVDYASKQYNRGL